MSEELKLSFYANGKQAVDQQMAKELFMAKARCGAKQARIAELEQQLAELDKQAQGYYNEASEGWSKYRKAEQQLAALREKYNEILYQVVNKIPGKTRHEAAVRIIRSHEHQLNQPEGKQ